MADPTADPEARPYCGARSATRPEKDRARPGHLAVARHAAPKPDLPARLRAERAFVARALDSCDHTRLADELDVRERARAHGLHLEGGARAIGELAAHGS